MMAGEDTDDGDDGEPIDYQNQFEQYIESQEFQET